MNNQEAGSIAWSPEELDVTNLIMDGENEITIKIVGSLKNTFGQFYDKKLSWIYGPHGWNNAPDHQPAFDKYHLKDYGLIEPFDLMTTTK